jgi:hypothetical protein
LKSETERLWYVRLAGQVRGPFPSPAIIQDLAVGRLPADTELSTDRINWAQPAELEVFSRLLQPDESDAWAEERRQALGRWADERDGRERRALDRESGTTRRMDRRAGDNLQRTTRTPRLAKALVGPGWLVAGSLVVLLVGLVVLALLLGSGSAPEIKLLK